MLAKRILVTRPVTSHLVRPIEYACELGATVLQMGFGPAITSDPPASYQYEPINDAIFEALNGVKMADAADREAIRHEIARLATLAAEFAPDVYHAVEVDGVMRHLGACQCCSNASFRPWLS